MPNGEYNAADYGLDPERWQVKETSPLVPTGATAPMPPPTQLTINPNLRATLPLSVQLEPSLTRQTPGGSLPTIPVMPVSPSGNAGVNAAATSIATTVVQQAINAIPEVAATNFAAGNRILITGDVLSTTDPTVDGNPIWEIDPGFVVMRDDFISAACAGGTVNTSAPRIGELNWFFNSLNGGFLSSSLGAPPNWGTFSFANVGTANEVLVLVPTDGSAFNTALFANDNTMALLDYPSWQATYIWKTDFSIAGTRQHTTTKKSMYIGFVAGDYVGSLQGNISTRPNTFMGIRFDTSVSPGTLSVTAVAAASGGNTVYTITTNALGTSNGFAGTTFVCTNCGNAANNGTFFCTASSSTSITLLNAAGVAASSLTGSATGPTPPNDSFYTFEVVNNLSNPAVAYGRNNQQGQTFVTNVAPVAGVWHRLDIVCTAVGVVTMTLDGSATNTKTFTVPVQTISTTSTITSASVSNGSVQISWSQNVANGGFAQKWGQGTKVTISGFTSVFNGTFPINRSSGSTQFLYNNPLATGSSSPTTATMSGYPAWIPVWWLGNDDTASPTANSIGYYLDFFGLLWNPGVNPTNSTTALATKDRYF